MVVENGLLTLLLLQTLDVFVQKRLKQLNSISIHFKVHKPMGEDGVAVGDLHVELSLKQGILLHLDHSVDDLLVAEQLALVLHSLVVPFLPRLAALVHLANHVLHGCP